MVYHLHEIGSLIEQARNLAIKYKVLTGKPPGITGEVAEYEAARLLGLELAEARTPGYDALRGSERIQIKGRVIGSNARPGQRMGALRLEHEWDAVLLVILDEEFNVTEIWEAGRKAVEAALAKPGSKARNQKGALPVNTLKQIGMLVWRLCK
jgi:hypothetical protein